MKMSEDHRDTYVFKRTTAEGIETEVKFQLIEPCHSEITEAYISFLRLCTFNYIKDVEDLQ